MTNYNRTKVKDELPYKNIVNIAFQSTLKIGKLELEIANNSTRIKDLKKRNMNIHKQKSDLEASRHKLFMELETE